MADYKEIYLIMARETGKAVRLVEEALNILITAERNCEDMYINAPEPVISLVEKVVLPWLGRREEGAGMVYTEAEKHRMDNILKAFAGFIKEQNYFDIVYSEKVGYLKIYAQPCELEPPSALETAEEMMDMLMEEVINEVIYAPNHKRIDPDAPDLSADEEAESRRILTAIVETMEEEREYWLAYVDRYLTEYGEKFVDE